MKNIKITNQKIVEQYKLIEEYHKKYLADKKPITLMGINFDIENKCIEDYLIQVL